MDADDVSFDDSRRSSYANGAARARRGSLYRRGSNMSEASFITDVEMAQDEVFSGPLAESVPTSVSAFSHRRFRSDSNASFAFYDEERDDLSDDLEGRDLEDLPEEAIEDDDETTDVEVEATNGYAQDGDDVEAGRRPSL
ncbi:hypothetical protein LTS18_011285, partial [Coniosporium uncinatum]